MDDVDVVWRRGVEAAVAVGVLAEVERDASEGRPSRGRVMWDGGVQVRVAVGVGVEVEVGGRWWDGV